MEKALEKYKKEFVDEKRAVVQKKLPETPGVNLLDVIGIVKEVIIEGNEVLMDVEFFPNVPEGLVTEAAITGGTLHLRTHGIGSIHLQDDGTYIVGDDYEFISCFVTNDPA
jgi:hypothetical protein